jgi:hypothetical protein
VRIELVWPDGSLVSGASWEELEAELWANPWNSAHETREAFRREMCHRAGVWTGMPPADVEGASPEAFIRALADTGVFILHIDS